MDNRMFPTNQTSTIIKRATSALISISLYFGLLLINWEIAIISALIFGFSYYFLALILKEKLSMNSYVIANLGEKQIKSMQSRVQVGVIDGDQLKNLQKVF